MSKRSQSAIDENGPIGECEFNLESYRKVRVYLPRRKKKNKVNEIGVTSYMNSFAKRRKEVRPTSPAPISECVLKPKLRLGL